MAISGRSSTVPSYGRRVKDFRLRLTGCIQDKSATRFVHVDNTIGCSGSMTGQNRVHGLHGGHDLSVCRQIVISQCPHFREPLSALRGRTTRFDVAYFPHEPLDDFDAVAALSALTVRFE